MIAIDRKKVPVKYALGFTKLNPSPYDMLYEIITFLNNERKDEFTESELKSKTKSRVPTFEDNLQTLLDEGFLQRGKYNKLSVINHPWK